MARLVLVHCSPREVVNILKLVHFFNHDVRRRGSYILYVHTLFAAFAG